MCRSVGRNCAVLQPSVKASGMWCDPTCTCTRICLEPSLPFRPVCALRRLVFRLCVFLQAGTAEESFAACILHNAVYLGLDGVVQSMTHLSKTTTWLDGLWVSSLATIASASRSSCSLRVVQMLKDNGVDFDVRCAILAAERGNASVLRSIIQNRPMLSVNIGIAALNSRHGPTVEVAYLNGCFADSKSKETAKRILADWQGPRSIKCRRVLPRSFCKETRPVGALPSA